MRRLKTWAGALAAVILVAAVLPATSLKADPAVSGVNAKISGFGGSAGSDLADDDGFAGLSGSLTLPVGYAFGLQLDGTYASIDGDGFGSTGAHFFWRDPKVGLLGVYGGYAHLDRNGGIDLGRTGLEAQLFRDRLTIDTAVGYRFLDVDDEAYGRARLQYYPVDNLMLSAGFEYEGESFGSAGVEYQVSSSDRHGLSIFANGRVNDDENYLVLGGMRMFFGDNMSLIDRHRRQDPDDYASADAQGTQQAGSNLPAEEEKCSFTPAAQMCCGSTGSCRSRTEFRYDQCRAAGYTFSNPGPDACGCKAAFDKCSP